jgi:outer membrane protein assembly factor BamD
LDLLLKINKVIFSLLLSILLISCSTTKPEGKTEAEVLYKEAEILKNDGRYIMATEKLNMIRSQYPYSFYATPAELMLADVLFLQENYVEAAAAYILFRDFHPRHKDAEYVVYKIAESYHKQIPDTHDRDLSSAVEAIRHYKELIDRHPNSQYVADAELKIKKSYQMLYDKEKYVADFYYKTKVFDAARYRYIKMLREIDEPIFQDHAMKRIIMSSHRLKEWSKCHDYADKFLGLLTSKSRNEVSKMVSECNRNFALKTKEKEVNSDE